MCFCFCYYTMQAVRFELTKQTAQDLKPCPFDRSGTLACILTKTKIHIIYLFIIYLFIYIKWHHQEQVYLLL